MTALVQLYGTDHAALLNHVRKEYGLATDTQHNNPHRLRREAIAQRLRLYRDDGEVEFARIIELIFEKADVQKARKKMIGVAAEQNVTRRIVDEVASLYDQPAVRTLLARQDQFRELALEVELDEVMQEAHRLTFLCNEVLLWQRAGVEEGDAPELHIVTPDAFDAIPHPKSPLRAAGFLIDMAPCTVDASGGKSQLPHYELWDDTYRYLLNAEGTLVDETGKLATAPIQHGLSSIPAVLFHRRKPVDRILDARAGRDIVSAHLGIGLLAIMVMQLSKSQGERQPVLKGNLANVAKGQSMNGEGPVVLPPEVEAFMLDTKTDSEHYLAAKKDKLAAVAATYGMSYEQLTYQQAPTSGKEWQARRSKLTELRNEQRRRALLHERGTVKLMGFDATGLRVDYTEQAMPSDAAEELSLLKDKMPLGLDSPVKYMMRKNPDQTREEAVREIKANLADYSTLMVWVRALNMPSGANADNPGKSPQENGANNTSSSEPSGNEDANPASGATTRNPETGKATAAEAGAAA